MANPGTAASPWSTLEAVFTAGKIFTAGDTLLLRTGYHGSPQVTGNNTGIVTIQPDAGASPLLRTLIVTSGKNWLISGLDICPENAGAGTYDPNGKLVDIQSTASYVTIQNCILKNALNITSWTTNDWKTRIGPATAIFSRAPSTTISNNTLRYVGHGIHIDTASSNSVVYSNSITDFFLDGIRALANNCTYEYNTVANNYVENYDYNHDDCFQSWTVGADGVVGNGTNRNCTVRGNVFITQTDPNHPYPVNTVQGIGCFDGMYENWVIENNLIVVGTWHGISLYGALNCKIVNNTVVKNPYTTTNTTPWIQIFEHKTSTVPSSGNLIRNNVSHQFVSLTASMGTADHNLPTSGSLSAANYSAYFVSYTNLDFSLKATSPAVGAGVTNSAPTIDINRNVRNLPYDSGAYEYGADLLSITTISPLLTGTVGVAYSQILAANGGKTPYTWGIAYGSLPAGLGLVAGSGAITGTPTTVTTANFGIMVADSVGTSATNNFSLTIIPVQPLLITTTSPLPTGTVGTAYIKTLAATGGIMPYTWGIAYGSLPAGLGLVAGSGAITGTPTTVTTANFGIMVADSVGTSATNNFSLTIDPLPVVTIATTTSNTTEGSTSPGVFTITRTGATTYNLTVTYRLSGTASNGTDYASLPGSVIISNGNAGAAINALSLADVLVEPTETVIATLATNGNYNVGVPSNATVSILNNATTDYFTEQFSGGSTNDFDLAYRSVAFTPNGASNYTACLSTIAILPDVTGGTSIAATLGNNGSLSVVVTGGNSIYLYGLRYTNFWINANGNLTFGSGDRTSAESLSGHFSRPRIAMLWHDLNPGLQGTVTRTQLTDRVVVTFQSVRENSVVNTNTFQCTQYFDGRIVLSWLKVDGTANLVGLSMGTGTPSGFIESDLAAYDSCQPSVSVAATTPIAANWGGAGSGVFTVRREGGTNSNVAISFGLGGTASNGTDFAQVSSPVTIAVSQVSTAVVISPLVNGLMWSNEIVVLTVQSGGGYNLTAPTSATVTILQPPFDAWRVAQFGTNASNSAIAGDTADPDGDGSVNLLEYAFNRDPNTAETSGLVSSAVENISGTDYFTFSYARRQSPTDVLYTEEVSGDLVNWSAGLTTTMQVTDDGNGISETVKSRLIDPISSANQQFVRVTVTRQ
jgi:parallel beta-helix repeat protein